MKTKMQALITQERMKFHRALLCSVLTCNVNGELQKAVSDSGNDEALNMLNTMIEGKRLKDISDLPLDLAV